MGPGVLVRGQLGQLVLGPRPGVVDLGQQEAPGHPTAGGEGGGVHRRGLVADGGHDRQVGDLGLLGQLVHAVVVAVVAHERGVDGRGVQHRLPVGIGDPAEVSVAHGPVLPRGRGRSLPDHGFPRAADAAIAAHAGPAPAGGGDPAVGRRPDRSRSSCGRASTSPSPSPPCPARCSTPGRACARRWPSWPRSGVPAVVLFGIPEHKDDEGSEAWNPDGIVQLALRDLRDDIGDHLVLIPDLCLDEYTDHGHCGVLTTDGRVDNDATIERYALAAVAQAEAGADIVAPSGMMDGQVRAIRTALDGERLRRRGHPGLRRQVRLRPSTARSARRSTSRSPAVGTARATSRTRATPGRPWRRSASTSRRAPTWSWSSPPWPTSTSSPGPGPRSTCRWPPTTCPASTRWSRPRPSNGWIDGDAVLAEHLTAIRRAGADLILTYAAREIAGRRCERPHQHRPLRPRPCCHPRRGGLTGAGLRLGRR